MSEILIKSKPTLLENLSKSKPTLPKFRPNPNQLLAFLFAPINPIYWLNCISLNKKVQKFVATYFFY